MEDFFTSRNTTHHFVVDKVDDTGTEQYRDVTGLDGEQFTQVLLIQPHGFTSNSPKDAHMVGMSLGNMRDSLFLLGGEHPDYKPKKVATGDSAQYNQAGTILHLVGDDPIFNAKGSFTISVKSFVVKCGDVTVTIDGNGVSIKGGKVTHNDHDIGATHKHTDTQPGDGLTGVPQ